MQRVATPQNDVRARLHATAEAGTVGTLVRCFTEPEDLAASLLGGEFEYLRVPDRAFDGGKLRILRVADLVLQQAEDGPHITRGMITPGLAALILPLSLPGGVARVNGAGVHAEQVCLVPGGTEFTVSCTDRQHWAAIALPAAVLESWDELSPTRRLRQRNVGVLDLNSTGADRLARIFETAARIVDDPRNAVGIETCATGLSGAFLELLCTVLTDASSSVPSTRACREAHRVVRAADDFLDAEMDHPVYREQLCEAVGVSLRKLHDAFVAVTGLAPQAYLKSRRLALVRRALMEGSDAPMLVKSVALAHGFWHLGHFVKDYKALFGETPSTTLGARRRAGFRPAGRGTDPHDSDSG